MVGMGLGLGGEDICFCFRNKHLVVILSYMYKIIKPCFHNMVLWGATFCSA